MANSNPRAVVLFCSGYNSYMTNNNDWLASFFIDQNIAVYGYDHHSSGRSTSNAENKLASLGVGDSLRRSVRRVLCCYGRLGYIPSFDGLVRDALFMLCTVSSCEPGLPIFIIGESMGGAIALEASQAFGTGKVSLILLAPMCSLGKAVAVSPVIQWLGWLLAQVAPLLPAPTLKDTTHLHVKSPEKLKDVLADPLRWQKKVRLGTAFTLKGATAQTASRLHLYAPASILVLHGSSDAMCPLEGSMALLTASTCQDKILLEYTGGFHTLWAEPVSTRRRMLCDIVNWVAARAPGVKIPEKSWEPADYAQQEIKLSPRPTGSFHHTLRPLGTGDFIDSSPFTARPATFSVSAAGRGGGASALE